jgi:hypothetical protein
MPIYAYEVSPVREPVRGQSGLDFVLEYHGSTAAPVPSAENGVVVLARDIRGEGRVVVVDYVDNTAQLFANLQKIDVRVGQVVAQGEKIGIQGHTGNESGVNAAGNSLFTEVGHVNHRTLAFSPDHEFLEADAFISEYVAVLKRGGFNPNARPPLNEGNPFGGTPSQDGTSGFTSGSAGFIPNGIANQIRVILVPVAGPSGTISYITVPYNTSYSSSGGTSYDGSNCGCSDNGTSYDGSFDGGSSYDGSFDGGSSDNVSSDDGSSDNGSSDNGSSDVGSSDAESD